MGLLVQRAMGESDCTWNLESGSRLGADGQQLSEELLQMVH